MNQYIYLDGKFVSKEKAQVSCFDPGFMYGFGLFETMRSCNGKIFRLKKHLKRLFVSAKKINIDIEGKVSLAGNINRLIESDSVKDAYVKIIAWQGVNKTHTLAFVRKYPPYPYEESLYKKGVNAIISRIRQNEFSILAGIKSLNYLPFQLAYQEAQEKGVFEAILLNTKGYLCEGSRSNIFLVKNDTIFTPSLESGCLAGITRDFVIQLAVKFGIKVLQKQIRPDFLYNADEAFLTNSSMGIMPLVKIDNQKIANALPGKLSKMLLDKYQSYA